MLGAGAVALVAPEPVRVYSFLPGESLPFFGVDRSVYQSTLQGIALNHASILKRIYSEENVKRLWAPSPPDPFLATLHKELNFRG